MPITSSAKKALRGSKRKRVYNLARKGTMNSSVKILKKLVVAKSKDEAQKALSVVYKALDKAAKTGLIKKNTASRRKSRLAASIKKLG
jgi:small subunit ribosomal protein S20